MHWEILNPQIPLNPLSSLLPIKIQSPPCLQMIHRLRPWKTHAPPLRIDPTFPPSHQSTTQLETQQSPARDVLGSLREDGDWPTCTGMTWESLCGNGYGGCSIREWNIKLDQGEFLNMVRIQLLIHITYMTFCEMAFVCLSDLRFCPSLPLLFQPYQATQTKFFHSSVKSLMTLSAQSVYSTPSPFLFPAQVPIIYYFITQPIWELYLLMEVEIHTHPFWETTWQYQQP